MNLDIPTLAAVFTQITAVLGALLVFSWALNRQVQALAWWGSAFLLVLAAMGAMSLRESAPIGIVLLSASSFLALAYGVLYTGCRAFNGRRTTLLSVLTGAGVWCIAFAFISGNPDARVIVMSAIAATYSALSAWELWRHARQPLASRWLAIFLLAGLCGFNIVRGAFGFSLAQAFWVQSSSEPWSAHVTMVLATLMPALAFVFLSMAKEQLEYEHKQAALTDSLTGIPNRRAFLQNASALLSSLRARPASCLLFDLDNFKHLNDSYGHEVGDDVLRIFGHILSDHLRNGVFGRIGGEEFAAVVPLEKAEAETLAEEIRHSFASVGKIVQGLRLDATVSVGCATGTSCLVKELLHQADMALYQAKAQGRNIVVSTGSARA